MLYFVTSNKNKIDRANEYLLPLGINFTPTSLDVIEIQSESFEEIIKQKAKDAYSLLQQPLFVSDHSWSITALHGFPAGYMKSINHWFTPQDFLNLMRDKTNREAILTESICFTNGEITQYFSQQIKAHILYESKGEGEPFMTVSSFSDDGMSIAEKVKIQPSAVESNEVYKEFADWFKATF